MRSCVSTTGRGFRPSTSPQSGPTLKPSPLAKAGAAASNSDRTRHFKSPGRILARARGRDFGLLDSPCTHRSSLERRRVLLSRCRGAIAVPFHSEAPLGDYDQLLRCSFFREIITSDFFCSGRATMRHGERISRDGH